MSRLRTDAAQQLSELAARVAEGQRLARGRRYERQGAVFDLEVSSGLVTALVAGSRAEPYEVSIACKSASENDRRAAMDDPVAAVPRVVDVAFTCICPDWGDPCKHGVAVMLALAGEVDDDLGLLFSWRGLDDLVPPPPPGTESLIGASADQPSANAPAGHPTTRPGAPGPASDGGAPARADDVPSTALHSFFAGAVPSTPAQLVGPIEIPQLDAFAHTRILVDGVDAAVVLADALESIADHWLSR